MTDANGPLNGHGHRLSPPMSDDDGIAIIGMACVFPQAPNLHAFWRNIMSGVDAIGEPPELWEAERYLDSGRIKTSSGGYLRDLFKFSPHAFGIMPSSLDGGEPDQFLALAVAHQALADAGYLPENYDHRDTGIVLGHSTYLHRGQGTLIQNHIVVDQTIELLSTLCPQLGDDGLSEVRQALHRSLPASTPDIAPGLVPNVMTGRIANRLNLKGPNYLIDAACSSSLLAVGAAIDELRTGRSNLMLAGGVNASLPAEVSVIFTQLGALSARGKVRPFEAGSDGTLLGEGLGVVALKRVGEALADGDRIYAVIRGVGQASDGKGRGLLAPSHEGEALAIKRAYWQTGIDPTSIGLIEAHGTGIPLGDKTEIASLREVFGTTPDANPTIPVGSVKSMISHCIPAAGMAGLIKTALALHHRVMPPTLCDEVNPELGIQAPLYINTKTTPWIHPQKSQRRAGINSFGFGGINTHAIIEQAPDEAKKPAYATPWPAELCVASASDPAALVAKLEAFATELEANPTWTMSEIAAGLAARDQGEQHRVAFVAKDRSALRKSIEQATSRLRKPGKDRWSLRNGTAYSSKPLGGKVAFVFPGEGSQYAGMLSDLALLFEDVRDWLDFWCGLYPDAPGSRRTDIAFPPSTGLSPEQRDALDARLHDMDVGSEAVFVGGQAMHALLRGLGVTPDVMLGHSSGESSALAASGAFRFSDPSELAEYIRQLNAVYRDILADGKIPTGALMAIGALPLKTVEEHIEAVDSTIAIAMHNCANQLVLYGPPASIESLERRLADAGGICMLLPFDRGYHTSAFTEASQAFRRYYDSIGLDLPEVPLYSCASAQPFPSDVTGFRELAAAQWSNKVRFQTTIEQMFADGVTTFIEVGPSANLTSFINDILAGREYLALASNQRRRGGVEQVLAVLAQLYVEARPFALDRLFADRAIASIDAPEPVSPAKRREVVLDNTMPKIRLKPDDLDRLRQLVTPAAASPTASPPTSVVDDEVHPVLSSTSDANGVPSEEEPSIDSGTDPGVMSSYFGLMQTFLEQQTSLMHTMNATPGWAELDDAPHTQALESSANHRPHGHFLDELVEQSKTHLVARSHLHVHLDAFLQDHILSGPVSDSVPGLLGLSCVPMMVSLEVMAEACAALAGTSSLAVIERVQATDWIALDNLSTSLEVRAHVIDADRGIYKAELHNANGIAVRAEFGFVATAATCPPVAPLSEFRASVWNDDELYTCGMFHGPIFQSIQHIDGWDDAGIDAQLSPVALHGFFVPGEQPALVCNPILLDAMGQLAAYWIAQYAGTEFNCFPSTIDRIEFYAHCPENIEGLVLRARQQPNDPTSTNIADPRGWDFECVDASGQPLVRLSNLQNIYFPVPMRFYEVRRDPYGGWAGQPTTIPGRENVLLWELPMFSESFCSQSGNIFLRILALIYLSFEEREEWSALTGSLKHRRQWLMGRACLKEATRYWIAQQTGHLLYSTDIIVRHDDQGAPYVDGAWCSTLGAPSVSLSHDHEICLAAVTDPVNRVGIDREAIGRVQKPELLSSALTPTEQALLQGLDEISLQDRLLRIWCAKEAAAKFLGVGLQGLPNTFEVQFADPETHSALVEHAQTSVYVDLIREDTSIIALASELQQELN